MAKEKGKAGRPSSLGKDELTKLEVAFKAGMTDTDACATAGVTTRALYRYQKSHPEYVAEKAMWKRQLIGTAMMVVAADIASHRNVKSAMWLLDREHNREAEKLARDLTRAQAAKAKAEADIAEAKADLLTGKGDDTEGTVIIDDIGED